MGKKEQNEADDASRSGNGLQRDVDHTPRNMEKILATVGKATQNTLNPCNIEAVFCTV